jgi:hypothetical protein
VRAPPAVYQRPSRRPQAVAGAAAQSLNYIAKTLVVDLRAADFNNATGQWCVRWRRQCP